MKKYLSELSIADLNALREYCLYQSEHRNWEFDKWAKIGRVVIEELENRIDNIFKNY